MSGSSKQHGTNNTHSTESDWDETITLIVMAIAKGLAVLAWWSVLFPMISIPVIVSLVIGFRYGPVFGFILAALAVLGLVAWSQLSPVTFHDWVTARVRTRWRTWSIYPHRWTAISTLHGLTAKLDDRTLVPALRSVTIGPATDVAEVGILVGQSVADWQNKSAALAEAFRAGRVTIRSLKPGAISITAHHGDALASPIRLRRSTRDTKLDPSRVGVGATEAGAWWRLPVLGQHILVAGATGSGKGSVLWSIIAGLAPGVRADWVRLLVIDPRGGMEWRHGIRTRADTVHRVRLRQRRQHPRPIAGGHDDHAAARAAAARSHPPAHPHDRRAVDRADRR